MDSDAETTPPVFATAVACEGGLAIVALGLGYLLKRPPWSQIEWSASAAAVGLLAALPLFLALLLVTHYPVGPFKALEQTTRQLLVPLFRSCTVAELLLISILAGIGEELLFRGVIEQGIEQVSQSPWLALAIASALFGAAHPISLTYALLAAAIGAYLGWLWSSTGNLLVPIVTHAAYDFAALVYLLRRPLQSSDRSRQRVSDC